MPENRFASACAISKIDCFARSGVFRLTLSS